MREVRGRGGVLEAGLTVMAGGLLRRVSITTHRRTSHVRQRLPRWRTSSRCCARAVASGPRWPSSHATGEEEEIVRTGEAQAEAIAPVGTQDGRTAVGGRGRRMADPLIMGRVGSRGRMACGLLTVGEVRGSSTVPELRTTAEVRGSSAVPELHITAEVQERSTVPGRPREMEGPGSSTVREGPTGGEGRERLTADGLRTAVEGRERLAGAILRQLQGQGTRAPANPGTAGAARLLSSPMCPAVSVQNREAPPRSRERLAFGAAPR